MSHINVNCVFGESHRAHLENVLLPSLERSTQHDIIFNVINYSPNHDKKHLSFESEKIRVIEHGHSSQSNIGFAEGQNILARNIDKDFFVIINPDCVAQPGSIDHLVSTFEKAPQTTGIVEGRQWPFEHPKEYDPLTLKTPWASGAFALINTSFYKKINGMDERYFLYLEDVDLSWRMWLAGGSVLYEPSAVVTHFTGGRFYRNDLLENEKYFSIRNFVLIMRKFYGSNGEAKALRLLDHFPDKELTSIVKQDISTNFRNFSHEDFPEIEKIPHIKVTGINKFHENRQ